MWRFGQTKPVEVDAITTPGGARILRNLRRKSEQADAMFTALIAHMNNALAVPSNIYDKEMRLPSWAS